MRRNSNIIGPKTNPAMTSAPGIHDTFDQYNSKRDNLWPINISVTGITPNSGTILENTYQSITVNSLGVEGSGVTLYWEIIHISTSASPDFYNSVTSGTFTQPSSNVTSFNIITNYIGSPSKSSKTFQIRIRETGATGRILYTSGIYTIPAVTFSSYWSPSPTDEGSYSYLYMTIGNCGTYTTYYHYIGSYLGTASYWGDFNSYNNYFYMGGGSYSYYYSFYNDITTEGNETVGFSIYTGNGYFLGNTALLTLNDTSQTPTATVTPSTTTVNEGQTVTFTVNTTNYPSGTLYWTLGANNITNADISNPSNAVTSGGSFNVSSSSGTFSLTISEDFTTEGTEYFSVSVRINSTTGTIIGTSSSINISDTSIPPSGTISLSSTSINEGESITCTVNTTNYPSGTLYWDIQVVSGNFQNSDFTAVSGTVSISSSTGSFTITASNDGFTEGAESFYVRIRFLNTATSTYQTLVNSSTITIGDTSVGGSEPTALYSFSSYTFTPAGATGNQGPTLGQCQAAYSGQAFLSGYFTVSVQGIQEWTVPATGMYRILAKGASGGIHTGSYEPGFPGEGATVQADISLNSGQKLFIVVGQKPTSTTSDSSFNGSAGGGGSWVYTGTNASSDIGGASNLIIVAGGGGGTGHGGGSGYAGNGRGGSSTTDSTELATYATYGVNSRTGNRTAGNLGIGYGGYQTRFITTYAGAGGGAGWLGNGSSYSGNGQGGTRFIGGTSEDGIVMYGGFGGGGGSGGNGNAGGGGGGYTGGGAGEGYGPVPGTYSWGGGAGGGSFVIASASNVIITAGNHGISYANTANGYITITKL